MVAAPPEFVAEANRHWLPQCLEAWRPRERLGGWQWADRERVLSREESPAPGPWRSLVWQREILDALADPTVDWIVILKAAQMGVSELVRCAVGRWALLDPGDVLWVVTTEQAARKAMKKLQAMFRSTPALRPLLSSRRTDKTLLELILTNGMRIVIGWAGSAQSLASDPFRYVILDEVAKYRWSVQGEGSPVDLAKERTKTYGRRAKIVLLSSPKDENDLIVTHHAEVADRRVFAIPCPACGSLQAVDWSAVRWPGGEPATAPTDPMARVRLADQLEADQSAWVACGACVDGKLLPHRAAFDERAAWVQEEKAPRSRRVAFHVPEFFHWETSLSDLVAKWLRCTTPRALQGFHNGSLGQPYKNERGSLSAAIFRGRAGHKAKIVPTWATTVLSTADTQLRGWWYMVRAWGPDRRSRLLDWGWVTTEEDLIARCVEARFDVEGDQNLEATPFAFAVDTGGGMETPDGSRTKQAYQIVARTRRAYALKGRSDREANDGSHWARSKVRLDERGRELELHLVNRNYYGDEVATLIRATEPEVLWQENELANDDYARQMSSEHLVMVTSGGTSSWLWQKRSKGAPNHLWDCARYQAWLAEITRVESREKPTWVRRQVRVVRHSGEPRNWQEERGWPGIERD